MASVISGLGGLASKSGGEAIAFGLGIALGAALAPEATDLAQAVWSAHPSKAVDAGTAAQIVAENVADQPWGASEAAQHGIDGERFAKLLGEALNAPGTSELLTLWRRGLIDRENVVHGLRKAKLEPLWDAAILATKDTPLDPAVVALGIVRGVVKDPGILPVAPPTGQGHVPAFPVFNVDALAEAAAAGIDSERLSVMVANMGRPASPDQAARAMWRGVATMDDYQRAISEGDVRNEWRDVILESLRQIPTVREYVEANLRGIIDTAAMHTGAGKHGMSSADADLIFETAGRPLAVHQITTGLARGAELGGTYDDVPEPYRDAIRRSNIRPEYARLAYANRYSYPSAFVLRALVQSGELTQAEGHQALLDIGWPPDLAAKVSAAWGGGTAAAPDKHVGKAETQLWTALHRSYVAAETDDTAATETLGVLGVAEPARPQVLKLWQAERELIRKQLTPAQVKKAYAKAVPNPATGQPWTRDDAIAALLDRGYSHNDATTYLET